MRQALGCVPFIAAIVLLVWVSTWQCSYVDPKSKLGWCYPPERSIGRAAVVGLKNRWAGVVIWR